MLYFYDFNLLEFSLNAGKREFAQSFNSFLNLKIKLLGILENKLNLLKKNTTLGKIEKAIRFKIKYFHSEINNITAFIAKNQEEINDLQEKINDKKDKITNLTKNLEACQETSQNSELELNAIVTSKNLMVLKNKKNLPKKIENFKNFISDTEKEVIAFI